MSTQGPLREGFLVKKVSLRTARSHHCAHACLRYQAVARTIAMGVHHAVDRAAGTLPSELADALVRATGGDPELLP